MVMQLATQESSMVAEEATAANNQTSKDDVARLLHLFKDPAAQIHWSNHYGVLNRAELDARRSSGPQSDAANSLSCLASIFNDYKIFKPQNQMVAYVYDRATGGPKKKVPYEPSHDEWAELANHTHDLEPTNLARRNILRDASWIKSTWNDVQNYLHQVFLGYNRSGQHDNDMGEWCSPKEQERWVRAAFWKTSGSNTIIRFPTVMIYSIAVLEQSDFESIGREMPKGTGIDSSVAGSTAAKKRKKRGKYNKKAKATNNNNSESNLLLNALQGGTQTDAQMQALRLMLEFGSATQKSNAMKEIERIAKCGAHKKRNSTEAVDPVIEVESEDEDSDENDSSSTSSN